MKRITIETSARARAISVCVCVSVLLFSVKLEQGSKVWPSSAKKLGFLNRTRVREGKGTSFGGGFFMYCEYDTYFSKRVFLVRYLIFLEEERSK